MRWTWIRRHRRLSVPRRTLEAVLDATADFLGVPDQGVTIVLAGDRLVARLKGQYLGEPRPTDVLAFPFREALPDGETYLGDIVLSVPTARRQARAKGHTLDYELAVLLVHGFLHLLGYDHEVDQGEMAALEREIRRRFIDPVLGRAHRRRRRAGGERSGPDSRLAPSPT